MSEHVSYSIPEDILQAICNNLNLQPAHQSRQLLNAIEAECIRQDQARVEAQRAQEREAIEAELKSKLQAKLGESAVHTPAPDVPLPVVNS